MWRCKKELGFLIEIQFTEAGVFDVLYAQPLPAIFFADIDNLSQPMHILVNPSSEPSVRRSSTTLAIWDAKLLEELMKKILSRRSPTPALMRTWSCVKIKCVKRPNLRSRTNGAADVRTAYLADGRGQLAFGPPKRGCLPGR